MRYILLLLVTITACLLARSIDIPRFGLDRIHFPEAGNAGLMMLGLGYSPLYMDSDSTQVTIYGKMSLEISDWLAFNAWFPHWTETRGSLLKAGPGDAICGLTASTDLPFVNGLRVSAFAQASIPSGYAGEHSSFPAFTSGANDFGIGGAVGFLQRDVLLFTANFSLAMPENMSTTDYRMGGGMKIYMPWDSEAQFSYLTDLSHKPQHDFNFKLSKYYKFVRLSVGFSKDFARHENSFGYNVGIETHFSLFEKQERFLPAVVFVDNTDWSRFPTEDSLWQNMLTKRPKYKSQITDEITIEYTLLDFSNDLRRQQIIPMTLRRESIQGRYSMNLIAKNPAGTVIYDENIYGTETRNGELIAFDSDGNDYTKYLDYTELQKVRQKALEDLFFKLHSETKRIRRSQY